MVDRIADKLPTWKASMIPKAGRLTLIRSVLAAIPLNQLIVLSLNKRALKQVEKIYNTPFYGVDCFRLLEVELEVMGATKREVFHLASLPRQVLDG